MATREKGLGKNSPSGHEDLGEQLAVLVAVAVSEPSGRNTFISLDILLQKVSFILKENFKGNIEHESDEWELIMKLNTTCNPGLNRDLDFLMTTISNSGTGSTLQKFQLAGLSNFYQTITP